MARSRCSCRSSCSRRSLDTARLTVPRRLWYSDMGWILGATDGREERGRSAGGVDGPLEVGREPSRARDVVAVKMRLADDAVARRLQRAGLQQRPLPALDVDFHQVGPPTA